MRVCLPAPDDTEAWRDAARSLILAGVAPDDVVWEEPGQGTGDLFAQGPTPIPPPRPGAAPVRASKAFLGLVRVALLHRAPQRFDLAYRLLWRLQDRPRAAQDAADPLVRRLDQLARPVRRDIHKMRAFLRFRGVGDGPGHAERFVAWFEPDHHILRANAGFFVRRFGTMRWSILTPDGSLHWNGSVLEEGPPATRLDAPGGDPLEELWRTYYANIFNPARLKVGAMLKEMPRKYWKNMPEAALIPDLIAGAQAREAAMVDLGRQDFGPAPESLAGLADGIAACRQCAIGCNGTRAVPGEGTRRRAFMIVGEQPGDNEEREGRPFVGPAGQVLRAQLKQAGIDPAQGWLTNAVKHFKHEPTGKRRLHQTPTAGEIDTCRWWLDRERSLVAPRLILALGASAARALIGRTASVQRERGLLARQDGAEIWLTCHPSYLLRLDGAAREAEEARFAADLRGFAAALA
nr:MULTISPECIES: UdgX family uracil-DNA binding protein [unclassified Novosphingobium]